MKRVDVQIDAMGINIHNLTTARASVLFIELTTDFPGFGRNRYSQVHLPYGPRIGRLVKVEY